MTDAAGQLALDRGVSTSGVTVGLFDGHGPAQRIYAKRGYLPDGRGACLDHRPLREGTPVTVDHDVMFRLTRELRSTRPVT